MFLFCYNDSDGCSNNDDMELCIKLYKESMHSLLCCDCSATQLFRAILSSFEYFGHLSS